MRFRLGGRRITNAELMEITQEHLKSKSSKDKAKGSFRIPLVHRKECLPACRVGHRWPSFGYSSRTSGRHTERDASQ